MKKILLGACILAGVSSYAQSGPDDAAFGPGAVTIAAGVAVPNFFSWITSAAGFGVSKSAGPFQAGVQFQVSKVVNLGVQYAYTSATSETMYVTDYMGNTDYSYNFNMSMSTILLNCDFYYINRKKIALYSGLGLGYSKFDASVSASDGKDHSNDVSAGIGVGIPGVQLRAIGVKANIFKGLGIYSDVGIGSNGIIAAGLHYTFGGKGKY